MLNIGVGELVVLLLIALIVVGPADLPKIAVAIAKAVRYLKRTSREIMNALQAEADRAKFKEVQEAIESVADPESIIEPLKKELSDVAEITKHEITDVNKVVTSVAKEELNQKIEILNAKDDLNQPKDILKKE